MSKKDGVLVLSLKKEWFDLMVAGKKRIEYRVPSEWIKSRLHDGKTNVKYKYDTIKFTNGYGSTKPQFVCKFKGFDIASEAETVKFGKSIVSVKKGTYKIRLGNILSTRYVRNARKK